MKTSRDHDVHSAYRENFDERNPIARHGLLPAMVRYSADSSLTTTTQSGGLHNEKHHISG